LWQAPKTLFFAGYAGILPAFFKKMRASRPRSQGFCNFLIIRIIRNYCTEGLNGKCRLYVLSVIGLDLLLNGKPEEIYANSIDIMQAAYEMGRKHIIAATDYLFYGMPEQNVDSMCRAAWDFVKNSEHSRTAR